MRPSVIVQTAPAAICMHSYGCIWSRMWSSGRAVGLTDGRRGGPYPRRPGDAQVLHHLLEGRRLLGLLLVMQSDLLAEFPWIV